MGYDAGKRVKGRKVHALVDTEGLPLRVVVHSAAIQDRDGTVGNLVRGAGFPSGSDEAIAEHDGELGLSLGPFAGRHFPLLSDLAQDQENELGRRLVAGEMASRPHGPSQLGVQGLDSIRGVDDFAHGRSKGEERDDLLPLSPPDLADRRIFAAP